MLQQHMNDILTVLADYKGTNVELEAKYGYHKFNEQYRNYSFVSEIRWANWNTLRKTLSSKSTEIVEKSVVYQNGDIRKRVLSTEKGDDVIWERKTRISNIDIQDYGIRVSISREDAIEPVADFQVVTIRNRTRYSFLIADGNVRVDLTDVLMSADTIRNRYEVEVEYVGPIEKLAVFQQQLEQVYKWLYDTVELYTISQKQQLITYVNQLFGKVGTKSIDRSILADSRNLKQRDLVWGGLVGNKYTGYTVTYKTDGNRKMFIVHPDGVWLVYPPNEYCLVKKGNFRGAAGTVFDGEIVPPERRRAAAPQTLLWYWIFDTLAWQGAITVEQKSHKDRMVIGQALANNMGSPLITVNSKTFVAINSVDSFYTVMRSMLAGRNSLAYQEDGLMFTPEAIPYDKLAGHRSCTGIPLHSRVLTRHPDICKWKITEQITIDFLIVKIPTGIDLYTVAANGNEVKFQSEGINPYIDQVDSTHPLTNDTPTGSIVEYSWNKQRQLFVPYRVRRDKNGPNCESIAIDNWEMIHNPLTEADLGGETFTLLYRYHNQIKRSLLQLLPKGANILDIGSGRGGDVSKWLNFGKIVAVEPDDDNRQELLRRIDVNNMTRRIKILPVVGEATDIISQAVQEYIAGPVDAVTLMLSLSFFWKDSETLDSLVSTIVNNVKEGGYVLFLTIDGDAVEQSMEPTLGGFVYNEMTFGNVTLRLGPPAEPPAGRKQYISIPDTIVGDQLEYVVHINDLVQRLQPYGFQLKQINRAEGQPFLTTAEQSFSSLYSFGYLQRISEKTPVSEMRRSQPRRKIVPKEEIDNNQLPSLHVNNLSGEGDDTYEPVKCTWFPEPVVRIAAIGDGSCFIHAFCKAFYKSYQENASTTYRRDLAAQLRRDLAVVLALENPDYPGFTYWETAAHGQFPALLIQELINLQLITELKIDFSLAGLQAHFNSADWLGDAVYSYIAEVIGIDVYILRGTKEDLYPHASTNREGVERDAIVIMGNSKHYEVIAVDTTDGFQTVFSLDDPFILALRKLTPEGEIAPAEFDPLTSFANHIQEGIPANVESIFKKDDPFIQAIKRAREAGLIE